MNENICKLGRLLFGERWVPQAARAVNFSTPRYMQRVAAGTHPISNGAARDLIKYAIGKIRFSDFFTKSRHR